MDNNSKKEKGTDTEDQITDKVYQRIVSAVRKGQELSEVSPASCFQAPADKSLVRPRLGLLSRLRFWRRWSQMKW